MPFDLSPLLEPDRTAVIVFECQEGVIGDQSHLPSLARAARDGDMVGHIAGLLEAARAAGVRVFYCKVVKPQDGVDRPAITPLAMRLRSEDGPGGEPDMGGIVEALAPRSGDVVVVREHGLTGFHASGLDAYLRDCRIRTIVLTGVSVNIGVQGTAIEAVNRGYRVVVPSDCVAGDPPEFAEQALRYVVRNVAFLSTAAEIEAIWSAAP